MPPNIATISDLTSQSDGTTSFVPPNICGKIQKLPHP
jgi:hypothetical protein